MRRPTTRLFSRREFLAGVTALASSVIVACMRSQAEEREQSPGTAPSTPGQSDADLVDVRATIEPGELGTPAPPEDAPTSTPSGVYIGPAGPEGDVTQTDGPPTATPVPPDQWPSVRTNYAAIVSRRLQVRDVSHQDLIRLWNGEITDWGYFGDPSAPEVKRLSVAGQSGPFPLDKADLDIVSFDDLESFLRVNRGALALIPHDRVDFRFRTLRIDGLNVHSSPGEAYPLFLEQRFDPAVAPPPPPPSEPPPETAMMTFVGDIIFGRYVHKRLAAIGDFSASFWAIHEELKLADVTIGDLECSLSDSFPQPEDEDPQTFLFKTWTDAVEGLKLADIDVLARANNHSFNFGAAGMEDTTQTLNDAGILHFGMGHNLEEARAAAVVEVKGTTYAFLGYNGISDQWDGAGPNWPGTAPLEEWLVVEDIERELAAGHVVIPYFHWGVEYVADPTEQQRYFAHLAIDAGAAIVIGSHPHWVQAVETYNGKPIIYSLGNFVFDQAWSRETQEGMYANVWLQRDKVVEIDLIPVLIEDEHRPRRMDEREAYPVLQRVWQATDRIIDGT